MNETNKKRVKNQKRNKDSNNPSKKPTRAYTRVNVKNQVISLEEYTPIQKELNFKFNPENLIKDAFEERKFKSSLFLILLKNTLLAFSISYFLYQKLNFNSFSFHRITFSDATYLGLKVFFIFTLMLTGFFLVLYLIANIYKINFRIKRLIASYGYGQIPATILYGLGLLVFIVNGFLGFLFIVLGLIYNILVLNEVVKMLDYKKNNLIFSFLSISTYLLIFILFWPHISKNFVRIVEIMF